ncbi:MAG TPA: PAS domain S-box protein, partial [Dissulfurispiraceae bacterium]|nr:PAS domain S-box protein [Dissulfurispiraceae bacterium]
ILKRASAVFTDSEDKKTVAAVIEGHESIGKLFRAIVENRQEKQLGDTGEIAREIEDRLLSQLDMRVYEAIMLSDRLQASSNANLVAALLKAAGGILFILVLAGISTFANSWTMSRSITGRIKKLNDGASAIGEGNYEHRIGLKGDDEFAVLSASFDAMTAKLHKSMCLLEEEITDRKKAEEGLYESHERLKKVLEVETVGVMFWDLTTGCMTDANNTFLNMMGYSRSDVEAGELTWKRLTPPEYVNASLAEIRKFQETGRVGPYEKEYLCKDGKRHWLLFAGSSLGNNNCVEFCVDIANRKRAEEALRASRIAALNLMEDAVADRKKIEVVAESLRQNKEDFARAQEVGQIGSWRLDVQRNVLTWSDENHRIFDIPKGTPLTYESFLAVVHPDDREFVDTKWKAGLRGEPYDFEHRIIADAQIKWVREKAYLEFDESGTLRGGFGITQDITGRKQTELAVRRLAQFPEENPNVVMRLSVNGVILYANRPARDLLKSAEMQGEDSMRIILEQIVTEAAALSHVLSSEIKLPTGITMLFYVIRPEGESYVNIYGIDISKRKFYEDALLESEERLRLAIDAAKMATWEWNLATGDVVWNDAHYRMLGYAINEVNPSYRAWTARVHPDDFPAVEAALQNAMNAGGEYRAEFRAVWPDGSEHWIESISRFERNARREKMRNYGVMLDITQRKADELELKKSRDELEREVEGRTAALLQTNRRLQLEISERQAAEERLIAYLDEIHDLYESAPCGYHSLDKNGVFIRMNDTELRWLGYRRDEVIGRLNFEDLLTEEGRTFFSKSFLRLKETGEARDLEYDLMRKDGSLLPVLINATAVKDADGNFVMTRSSVFDISERRKAEKEAVRAAHLASIGELAAGVAHEINNPINSIINYAQILANKADTSRPGNEFPAEIIREGERIATIVSSLLSFSRKPSEVKHPVSVQEILNSTLALTAAQLQKDGIHLHVDIPEHLPYVMAIGQQLQQVFLNVISNARYALNQKYAASDDGKTLEIRADSVSLHEDNMIRVSLLDTGIGMSPSIAEKATEAFFTTKPARQGTGLGLSICNNIVMKHGGSLTITSEEGRFTEISILLPAMGGSQ